jgi:hypothetical protein
MLTADRIEVPDDDMTIERWIAYAGGSLDDGWTPAQFKVANGEGDSFGWTKANFGIYEGRCVSEVGGVQVASLNHLPSGYRVALLDSPQSAALAATLAERVGDWTEIGDDGLVPDVWKKRAKRMWQLWQEAGLVPILSTDRGRIWCAAEPFIADDSPRPVAG